MDCMTYTPWIHAGVYLYQCLNNTLLARSEKENGVRGTDVNDLFHEPVAEVMRYKLEGKGDYRVFSDIEKNQSLVPSFDGEQKSADVKITLNGKIALIYFDKLPGGNLSQNKGNYIQDPHAMTDAIMSKNRGSVLNMCNIVPERAPYWSASIPSTHMKDERKLERWQNFKTGMGPERLANFMEKAHRTNSDFNWAEIVYKLRPEFMDVKRKSEWIELAKYLKKNNLSMLDPSCENEVIENLNNMVVWMATALLKRSPEQKPRTFNPLTAWAKIRERQAGSHVIVA